MKNRNAIIVAKAIALLLKKPFTVLEVIANLEITKQEFDYISRIIYSTKGFDFTIQNGKCYLNITEKQTLNARISELYLQGYTNEQIHNATGIVHKKIIQVTSRLKKSGVKRDNTFHAIDSVIGLTKAQLKKQKQVSLAQEIKRLKENCTYKEIEIKLGLKNNMAQYMLKKYGR